MANIPFSTLYPELQLYLPGCSEPLINAAVVAASIDFCERTLMWWQENPAALCPAGSGTFLIPIPAGANNAATREVYVDGIPLKPYNTLELNNTYPEWMTATGYPSGFIVEGNSFRLIPINSTDVQISCRVAYKPTRSATDMLDWMYEDWWEVLKAGTLARLLLIPGQTWSKPDLAMVFKREFDSGCRAAKVEANKNRSNSTLKVKFRPL